MILEKGLFRFVALAVFSVFTCTLYAQDSRKQIDIGVGTGNSSVVLEVVSHMNGDPAKGITDILLEVSNPDALSDVSLSIDGQLVGTLSAAPYAFSFNSAQFDDGVRTLYFDAFTTGNDLITLDFELFFNNNSADEITGAITSPAEGDVLTGLSTVTVEAQDIEGVRMVLFYIDGVYSGADNQEPYEHQIATDIYSNGQHEITAKALDFNGVTATSAVTVTFQNAANVQVPKQDSTNQGNNANEQPDAALPSVDEMFSLVNLLLNTLITSGASDALNAELLEAITTLTEVLTTAIDLQSQQLKSQTRTKKVPRLMRRANKRIYKGINSKKRKRKKNFRSSIRKLRRMQKALAQ